jgi:hypothetical protein
MRIRTRFNLLVLLFICTTALAQIGDYSAKREILGVSEPWHSLELPTTVFENCKDDLADIRIYGITPTDTLEIPYLLRIAKEAKSKKEIAFKMINESNRQYDYYFTFEVPTHETLNDVELDFKNENFDWNIRLEGSQDQMYWFTILEKHRILSIKNSQTDYRYTHLNFPNAKYHFYRISFRSETQPELKAAKIYLDENTPAQYNIASITKLEKLHQKDKKQTVLEINLEGRTPISYLSLDIPNEFDYYRSFQLQYAQDSVSTEKGWKYNYRSLYQGTLNSIEKNEFKFTSVLANKLKLIIEDHDNQPLEIKNVKVKGYIHELIARFPDKGDYFLVYGNPNANVPKYDIAHSANTIPNSLTKVKLVKELKIPKKPKDLKAPLFENKLWLWGVMGIIIMVLGGFTLKMMSKK